MKRRAFLALLFATASAPAWAAFPTVVSRNTSTNTSAVTTHVVSLPASLVAGNKITVTMAFSGSALDVATPSGWTSMMTAGGNACGGATACVGFNIEKVSTGSEGSTLNVTTTSSRCSAHSALQIGGAGGIGDAEASGSVSEVDPPNKSAFDGIARDFLWLATGFATNPLAWSAAPTNYSNFNGICSVGCSQTTCAGTGERQLNAVSENPGTFGSSTAPSWFSATFNVNPSSAAIGRRIIMTRGVLDWFLAPRAYAAEARMEAVH